MENNIHNLLGLLLHLNAYNTENAAHFSAFLSPQLCMRVFGICFSCFVFPLSTLISQRLKGFIEAPECEKQHRNSMSNVRIGRLRRRVFWLPEVSHCLTSRGQREKLPWEKHNYCKHLPSI